MLISIFLKAIFDIDSNYDVGWYHLPFAARIWRIIPAESFTSGGKIEYRYDGFPLLAHFFQGLLWKITGRIQATNLVSYSSVIIYLFFLKNYFKIPLYISAIAIFTIPAVLTHAPTSLVDLPGNIGASVVIMMGFLFARQSSLPKPKDVLIILLAAAAAVNIKPQLQPFIFLFYWIFGIRLTWLYFKYTKKTQQKLWLTFLVAILASSLIFFTPIKNLTLYGNPFYPVKIEVAGIVLNHELTPETYKKGNRPRKWLQSIFEINTPDWSADQSNRLGKKGILGRAGGFFGAYVVFNLLLLVYLTVREHYDARTLRQNNFSDSAIALTIIISLSFFTANFPQSHELRYLMFWMITLVSLNLYLIFSGKNYEKNWFQLKYFKLTCLSFFIVMCIRIKHNLLIPQFVSLNSHLADIINSEVLKQISPNATNCIMSKYDTIVGIQHIFFYSSYFHPKIEHGYNIKVVNGRNVDSCHGGKIIVPEDRLKPKTSIK